MSKGRLFRIDHAKVANCQHGRIEHFWLCEKCATTMTVRQNAVGEVHVLPFKPNASSARAS